MTQSLDEFSKLLADSGILPAAEFEKFWKSLAADSQPHDAAELSRILLAQGVVTGYQLEQLQSGKGASLVLGNYLILDKLGQGGMGMVLKAAHRRMKRLVALKVISPSVVQTAGLLQRFQREVEAAARLGHPNIVQAFDADEVRGTHFLVMEYVPGRDLASIVKQQGPLNVAEAASCVLQAARGLEYAHTHGVIHRDIKPGNLLLSEDGQVKILDMGLARLSGEGEASDLTSSGDVLGTVDFMSPEQAQDTKHADARSDIYSLGCTWYYLLTGQAVYPGDTLMARLLAHRDRPIPSLRDRSWPQTSRSASPDGQTRTSAATDEVTAEMDELFQQMLAKDPDKRVGTMQQVIARLDPGNSSHAPISRSHAPFTGNLARPDLPLQTLATRATQLSQIAVEPATSSDIATARLSSELEKTQPGLSEKPQSKAAAARTTPRTLLIAAGFLAAAVLLGVIIIKITKPDGTTATIEVDEGSKIEIVTGEKPQPAAPPKPKESLSPSVLAELLRLPPVLVEHSIPLTQRALVSQPAPIKGLRSWSIEPAGGGNDYVYTILWHPSGKWFATYDEAGTIKVWSPTGNLQRVIAAHPKGTENSGLVFLDDGKLLASVSCLVDCSVRIWDTETWTCRKVIPYPKNCYAQAITWSPPAQKLFVATSRGVISVDPIKGDLQSSKLQANCVGISIAPDGVVAVTTESKKLVWLDPQSLKSIHEQPSGAISRTLAFSPDGKWLVAGGQDGVLRIWDAKTCEPRGEFKSKLTYIYSIQWFSDSRRLAVGSGDGTSVWDIDQRDAPLLKAFNAVVVAVAITPDEHQLVFNDAYKREVWSLDLPSGKTRRLDSGHGLITHQVMSQLSSQGDRSADYFGGILTIRDASNGSPLQRHRGLPVQFKDVTSKPSKYLGWSPDGKKLAMIGNSLIAVDPDSGGVREFRSMSTPSNFAWSPDSKQLASVSPTEEVCLWDAGSAEITLRFAPETKDHSSLTWSPDGKRLVGCDRAGTARIWNAETGKQEAVRSEFGGTHIPWTSQQFVWTRDSRQVWKVQSSDIVLWSPDTDKISPREPLSYQAAISGFRSSPDGAALIATEHGNGAHWRGKTATERKGLGFLGQEADWLPDSRRCLFRSSYFRGYDTQNFQQLGVLLPRMTDGSWITIGPSGHYRGGPMAAATEPLGDGSTAAELAAIEKHLVYVAQHDDGSHHTYTPAEFRTKFSWKNDPQQATLLALP